MLMPGSCSDEFWQVNEYDLPDKYAYTGELEQ